MGLDRNDIETIAILARLRLDEDEIDAYAGSLSRIVAFVDSLSAADTDGVAPMAHPVPMVQRLRADEPVAGIDRDRYQRDAPAVEDGLYLVPRVIE